MRRSALRKTCEKRQACAHDWKSLLRTVPEVATSKTLRLACPHHEEAVYALAQVATLSMQRSALRKTCEKPIVCARTTGKRCCALCQRWQLLQLCTWLVLIMKKLCMRWRKLPRSACHAARCAKSVRNDKHARTTGNRCCALCRRWQLLQLCAWLVLIMKKLCIRWCKLPRSACDAACCAKPVRNDKHARTTGNRCCALCRIVPESCHRFAHRAASHAERGNLPQDLVYTEPGLHRQAGHTQWAAIRSNQTGQTYPHKHANPPQSACRSAVGTASPDV